MHADAAVRDFWAAFNSRDLTRLKALFHPEYINHEADAGTPTGPEGQAQLMQRLWNALPDAWFEVETIAQASDVVMCVGTMSGTHDGALLGIPASGHPVSWRQCHILTVAAGQVTSHRAIRDDLGLLQQMGAA